MPWMRYRPRFEIKLSSRWANLAPMSPTAPIPDEAIMLARTGATALYNSMGQGPTFDYVIPERNNIRAKNQCYLAHQHGMKSQIHLLGHVSRPQLWIDNGWVTEQQMHDAQQYNYGTYYYTASGYYDDGHWPTNRPGGGAMMCFNSPVYRDLFLNRMNFMFLDQYNVDTVYWDLMQLNFCRNSGHEPDTADNLESAGVLEITKQFRDHVAGTEKHLEVHAAEELSSYHGRAGSTNPGEQFIPYDWIPNKPELECVYNSLLFGIQVMWLTGDGSGIAYWEIEAFEKMLRYCSSVVISAEAYDEYTTHKDLILARIQAYLSPLAIWRVDDSFVHHSDDGDYSTYAVNNTADITSIVYTRPDDLLVVVVKNQTGPSNASVTLKLDALGFTASKVLAYSIPGKFLETLTVTAGKVTLTNLVVQNEPVLYRIIPLPTETTEVWHDHIIWNVSPSGGQFTASGLPLSTGYIYFYAPSAPAADLVIGGNFESYDAGSGLAVYTKYNTVASGIQLASGWTSFATRLKDPVPWSNLRISDGSSNLSIQDAEDTGWVQGTIYYFDAASQTYKTTPTDDANLQWDRGYLIWSSQDALLLDTAE